MEPLLEKWFNWVFFHVPFNYIVSCLFSPMLSIFNLLVSYMELNSKTSLYQRRKLSCLFIHPCIHSFTNVY